MRWRNYDCAELGPRRDRGHRVMPPQPIYSGKVRDVYDAGGGNLLFVTSDRVSAFDVVMEEPVPDKGRVLTAMTAFWLDEMADLAPNHLVALDPAADSELATLPDLAGRSM